MPLGIRGLSCDSCPRDLHLGRGFKVPKHRQPLRLPVAGIRRRSPIPRNEEIWMRNVSVLFLLAVMGLAASGCRSTGSRRSEGCGDCAVKCAGCKASVCCGDVVLKCTGCGYQVRCAEADIKCPKCGAHVKCDDCKVKCTGCGKERDCGDFTKTANTVRCPCGKEMKSSEVMCKCAKCGAQVSCADLLKCPKCGKEMTCTGKCSKCSKS